MASQFRRQLPHVRTLLLAKTPTTQQSTVQHSAVKYELESCRHTVGAWYKHSTPQCGSDCLGYEQTTADRYNCYETLRFTGWKLKIITVQYRMIQHDTGQHGKMQCCEIQNGI